MANRQMFHEIRREVRADQTFSQRQRCEGEKGLRPTEFGRLFTYCLGKRRLVYTILLAQEQTNGTENNSNFSIINLTSKICSVAFGIVHEASVSKSVDYKNTILIQELTMNSAPRKKEREELYALLSVLGHLSMIEFKHELLKKS